MLQQGSVATTRWGVGVAAHHAPTHSQFPTKSTAVAEESGAVETTHRRKKIYEPVGPRVGTELRVWWSAESQWFDGVIDARKMELRQGRWLHHITYTDGDDQWHYLPSMDWAAQLATDPKWAKASMAAKRKNRPQQSGDKPLGGDVLPSSRPKIARICEKHKALDDVKHSHVAPPTFGRATVPPSSLAPNCRRRRLVREARRRARRAHGSAVWVKGESESLHKDATSLLALRSLSPATVVALEQGSTPRRVELSRIALVSQERFERSAVPTLSWCEAHVGESVAAFKRVPSRRARVSKTKGKS